MNKSRGDSTSIARKPFSNGARPSRKGFAAVRGGRSALVLGVMSGTSMDGVDYALCEVTRASVRLVRHWHQDFPSKLRRRLHAAAMDACGAHELAQLHHDLGRLYAAQAKSLRPRAELAGLHGQTVFHHPHCDTPATLQIGEAAYLAEALRVPVVSNFRVADMAAGGQGAPLATLFHRIVFGRRGHHVCVNNLGGISNVTSLDWAAADSEAPRVVAFDTGPGNVLLDLGIRELTNGRRHFDVNGAWASRGRADESLLKRWLAHPFFRLRPPKSTGRELFGERFWQCEQRTIERARLSQYDFLATLTEFTARSIALNYERHLRALPHTVVLCGGGAENAHLVERIRACLQAINSTIKVTTSAAVGWPAQAVEPAAFALLAYYRWKGLRASLPMTTGARRAVLLGCVSGL